MNELVETGIELNRACKLVMLSRFVVVSFSLTLKAPLLQTSTGFVLQPAARCSRVDFLFTSTASMSMLQCTTRRTLSVASKASPKT